MELRPGGALVLSNEFKVVLRDMEMAQEPMFITGRAGTGKSTLLKLFRKLTRKKLAVVAPTGIAALNVRGQTIHSFFGFPPKLLHPSDIHVRRNRRLYENLEILVIDEISMVRADMLDNIDYFLRINRNIDAPFGGVKVIFFGDLFQLPPVVATQAEKEYIRLHYETPYFFSSKVFTQDFQLVINELHHVFRQTDRRFINLLDNIRMRSFDYDDLEDMNSRFIEEFYEDDYYVHLCARNDQVHRINKDRLAEVDAEEYHFLASVTGDFSERLFPTDLGLKLRVGAQVMFIKNDPEKRFVNGTIGKVVELDTDLVKVSIMNEDETISIIDVDKYTWEILKYKPDPSNLNLLKTDVIGSFTQYPLKLAWAVTIHKSQGKTFDRVIIDLGKGAFESGQAYVALSRCRTMEGIVLKKPLKPTDIFIDPRITEFYLNAR